MLTFTLPYQFVGVSNKCYFLNMQMFRRNTPLPSSVQAWKRKKKIFENTVTTRLHGVISWKNITSRSIVHQRPMFGGSWVTISPLIQSALDNIRGLPQSSHDKTLKEVMPETFLYISFPNYPTIPSEMPHKI
jgi:hypothetical protein